MHFRSLRAERGVTIIELMVVVAIMAIIAAIAAPNLTRFIDAQRLRGAADDVVSVIAAARGASVKHDLPVAVGFAGGSDWCVGAKSLAQPAAGTLVTGTVADFTCSDATTLVGTDVVRTLASNHRGVSMGNAPATIQFDPKSGLIAPLGTRTLTLTSPKAYFSVRLDVMANGQASLCAPGATFSNVPSC